MSLETATILAVDDNATIRRAIAMRLGAHGMRVETAADGKQALDLVERKDFDLVLLDLQMPEMRGDEVLIHLRQKYSETQLPVIMLAASDDKKDISRTLELGANDYVTKPGDLPILLARIKKQLALKEAANRLEALTTFTQQNLKLVDTSATCDGLSATAALQKWYSNPEGGNLRKYHLLYDNTPMTCFTLNRDLEILDANRFGARFLGYDSSELRGRSMLELYAPDTLIQAQEYLEAVFQQSDRIHRWEIKRRKRNGDDLWMRETARVIGGGDEAMILMTCEDIDDTYKLSEKLSYHSAHDDLTGLNNRKTLEERLARVIESAHSEDTHHTLAIADLDQFKIINDSCGYEAGDELLKQIARLMRDNVRKRDTVARIGGDEFAILFEDCPMATARETIDTIRTAVEAYGFEWNERGYRLSISVGLGAIDSRCDGVASALSMADTACYAAKDAGRNRVHAYVADDASVVSRHGQMRWVTRINDALRDDRFELSLQQITPVSGAHDGDHYELLIRMRDERGHIVMPGEFFPAAERYNLADKLDRWVIKSALAWLAEQRHLLESLYLCSINLSGQSINNEEVLSFILREIDASGIPPSKLCFEVTETVAIADLMQATRFISLLKEKGCMFALDDFGSGFSSFSYLKALPVDFVKIDGSFVRDIAVDSIDRAMVRSINEIGHVMGKKTIAEFVEDGAILEILRSLGVDYAQGYGIGRPIPLDQFLAAREPSAGSARAGGPSSPTPLKMPRSSGTS
jgi:diguanylate cyclase (GGDEF)-like protein/PAS domain S-box-containing protein